MMKIVRWTQVLVVGLCFGCGGGRPSLRTSALQPSGSTDRSAVATGAIASNETEIDEEPVPVEFRGIPSAHPPPDVNGMIPLQVLLPVPDAGPPTGSPAPAANDKECVKSIGLLGQIEKDFDALSSACGAGAGMKQYTKAVSGKFDSGHKRDSFQVKLAGGYCYRFFAAADGTITKLGFRVHRSNGALHSVILGKQPVIVYRPSEPWCRRRDRDFQLVVETLEGGEGRYALGIWARPSEKGRAK